MQQSSFDDSCSDGLDALYALQGVSASYTPNGGSAATVSVLVDARTRGNSDKAASRSRIHTLRGSVRVSQVEELGRGDTIQLTDDSVVFKIVPSSVTNDGLEWEFEATAEVTTTLGNVRILPDH